MKKTFWDHSCKPSVFVEIKDGVETYRGPFRATNIDKYAEMKKEIDPSSFSDPFRSFNRVNIDLSKYSDEKILCFYLCTLDRKIVKNENNILPPLRDAAGERGGPLSRLRSPRAPRGTDEIVLERIELEVA